MADWVVRAEPGAILTRQPRSGGLPPDLTWPSVERFATKVAP